MQNTQHYRVRRAVSLEGREVVTSRGHTRGLGSGSDAS